MSVDVSHVLATDDHRAIFRQTADYPVGGRGCRTVGKALWSLWVLESCTMDLQISMAHHQHLLYHTHSRLSKHPRFLGWITTEYSTLDASRLWKRASGCTGRNPNPPGRASTSRTCAVPACAGWNLPSQPRSQSAPKATEAAVSRTGSGGATGVAPDRGDLRHASVECRAVYVNCNMLKYILTSHQMNWEDRETVHARCAGMMDTKPVVCWASVNSTNGMQSRLKSNSASAVWLEVWSQCTFNQQAGSIWKLEVDLLWFTGSLGHCVWTGGYPWAEMRCFETDHVFFSPMEWKGR